MRAKVINHASSRTCCISCPPSSPPAMTNTTRPKLPPGPSYIIDQIFSWKTAVYASFVVLIRIAANAAGVYVPVWAIVMSSVAALPAALYIQSEIRYWRDRRTAESLGARLATKVTGSQLFGTDLIAAITETNKSGYIGESSTSRRLLPRSVLRLDSGDEVSGWTSEFGQTIDLYFRGSSHVGLICFDCRHRSH